MMIINGSTSPSQPVKSLEERQAQWDKLAAECEEMREKFPNSPIQITPGRRPTV